MRPLGLVLGLWLICHIHMAQPWGSSKTGSWLFENIYSPHEEQVQLLQQFGQDPGWLWRRFQRQLCFGPSRVDMVFIWLLPYCKSKAACDHDFRTYSLRHNRLFDLKEALWYDVWDLLEREHQLERDQNLVVIRFDIHDVIHIPDPRPK